MGGKSDWDTLQFNNFLPIIEVPLCEMFAAVYLNTINSRVAGQSGIWNAYPQNQIKHVVLDSLLCLAFYSPFQMNNTLDLAFCPAKIFDDFLPE